MSSVTIGLADVIRRLSVSCRLDERTLQYVLRRLRNEGISFFTKTLPTLTKSVLLSLENGWFDRSNLTWTRWKGASLEYFSSWLDKLFCRSTGKILQDPCPYALKSLRQFCEYMYKLCLQFTDKVLEDATAKFLAIEEELGALDYDRALVEKLRVDFENNYPSISRQTCDGILSQFRPRFSRGTFSWERARDDRQRSPHLYKSSLDVVRSYPAHCDGVKGYFKPYPSMKTRLRQYDTSDCSEVLFVPKDSRGPRTIVREPLNNLRLSLAYFDYLTDSLQRETNGNIQFVDQGPFREKARESSITRRNCTMDLESASDRVSRSVVRNIFRNSPGLSWFISRATQQAKLGELKVRLNKLAGMGSGYTFPTMALLIHLASTRAIVDRTQLPYKECSSMVHVYGDDLIVPSQYFDDVRRNLESIGLRINKTKSYSKGFFRESCGGDYFLGVDVAPVRLKLRTCDARYENAGKPALVLESGYDELVSHAHELYKRNLCDLAELFYDAFEHATGAELPGIVSSSAPIMGRLDKDPRVITDECGNYRKLKYLLVVPVKYPCPGRDYSRPLAEALKPKRPHILHPSFDGIYDSGLATDDNIPIPYRKLLKKKRVSSIVAVTEYDMLLG